MQFSDPLGDAPLTDVAVFWLGRLIGVPASLLLAEWIVVRFLDEHLTEPRWMKPAIITMLIAAVPMTLVEMLLEIAVPQMPAFDDAAARETSLLLAFGSEYLTILSIILPINALIWVALHYRDTPTSTEELESTKDDSTNLAPAFLEKTKGIQLEDVIALQAEEHYVRVCTSNDSELIYIRLTDAIAQMPRSAGIQVHRSWWVADAAVARALRGDRRYRLELTNGDVVPVSDRFLNAVRKRGWMRQRQ